VSLYLSSLPLWLSALLVVVVTTLAAMCGPLVVRRSVGLERLITNNEVAGFKFAVLGVIYAVLLGFAVIVVWEKFRDAEAAAAQEAAGIVAIHRLAGGLGDAAAGDIRQHATAYAQSAIKDDWPAMAVGTVSREGTRSLDALYAAVLAFDPRTPRESAIMAELLTVLDSVTLGRRTRLLLASGIVPDVLWAVLFAGAAVTLSFTFFFGSRSVFAQALMTGMLAAIIFMALFVVVEIDHPFSGPVSVGPEAMRLALEAVGDTH
jgi:Na+/proline symporter